MPRVPPPRMFVVRHALALSVLCALACTTQSAYAEEEAPDATRLDVERLPPEAIEITRDMYDVGLHLQADVGGRGIVGGAGRIARPGPLVRISGGYELSPWFAVASSFAFSMHETNALAPPAATAFQLYTLLVQAKAQVPLGVRVALWLAAEGGIAWASGDFLQAWGFADAGDPGLVYGGELGVDWHLMNAHHSLGLSSGAYLMPQLDGFGESAIAIHGSAYLKYVF